MNGCSHRQLSSRSLDSSASAAFSRAIIAILLVTSSLVGCTATNFHGAKVAEPGQLTLGFGYSGLEIDVYGRYGLTGGLDTGAKLFLTSLGSGLCADLKYQFKRSVPFLAGDIGFSYAVRPTRLASGGQDSTYFGIYPTLLLGSERFYLVAKLMYIAGDFPRCDHPLSSFVPSDATSACHPVIHAGTFIGDRFRVVPELSIGLKYKGLRIVPWGGIAVEWRP